MGQRRITRAVGDYLRSFVVEGGVPYRHEHQDFEPAMKRFNQMREMAEQGRGRRTDSDRRLVGSVPVTLIVDWCKKHGYTLDQWARNDGGIPGMMYPETKSGVKDQFMKYFLSREFSKLHTQHTTTRIASSIFSGIGNGHIRKPSN